MYKKSSQIQSIVQLSLGSGTKQWAIICDSTIAWE